MTRTYIHRLHGRHARLDDALVQELRRPAPDAATLAALKKRKLQVKDRLRALELKAASEGFV